MEAIYQCSSIYTKQEHMKFERFAYVHTGRSKKVATHCFIMLAISAALIALLTVTERFGPSTVWLPLLWLFGALIYGAVNGSLGRSLSWKMSPQVHNAHQHFFFYPDRLDYYIGETGITVPYEAIHSIGETKENIYIMLSAQQGMGILKYTAPQGLYEFITKKVEESRTK